MESVNIPIDALTPYERNARKHGDEDVEAIAESIREFGFNDPVGVWGPKNIVVEGHGRLLAARKLGMVEIPCIRLDHLSDEQRRAYTLAHNKTAENSSWDMDMLALELNDIDMDMSGFGFDMDIGQTDFGEATQHRVANIENLDKAQYAGEGKYDIPIIYPVKNLPEIGEWIGFNYVLTDEHPEGKAVHFFIDDYQFERIWNQPERYVERLKRYICVASPDFSPYGDMPMALQIYNHYRKHWVAAYLQANGVTVIPTIRCSSDERSLEWYLDGEPRGGEIIISSMWYEDNKEENEVAYKRMIETLKPKKVYTYGGARGFKSVRGEKIVEVPSFSEKWGR